MKTGAHLSRTAGEVDRAPARAGEGAGRPIVIAAGGTGGHMFPAEALASELIARGARIVLMTDRRSGALNSPVFAGREQFILPGGGLFGRGATQTAGAAFGLALAVAQARQALARLNPRTVIGFGGYPSVAPVLASRFLTARPKVILHEQNAVLGRANRFLARFADIMALAFADTAFVAPGPRVHVVGNPVRPAIAAIAAYVAPSESLRLLVLGGSLGARVLSDVVPEAVALLPDAIRTRLSVVQQCRADDLARVREAYARAKVPADLAAFFPDVAERLEAAHLVVARAGASSVAELSVAGRPSILIPLPSAIDDHQSANARALTDAGGALAFPQRDLSPVLLAAGLEALFTAPDRLAFMAAAARAQGRADAASRLADLLDTLMTGKAPA